MKPNTKSIATDSHTFAYINNGASEGWWLMLQHPVESVRTQLIRKFGQDWWESRMLELNGSTTLLVNRVGGFHHLNDEEHIIGRRVATGTITWPMDKPSTAEMAHPRADSIKDKHMLNSGPLAGHFWVNGEIIVCARCGRDLTDAAKILGQPDMVMAHHAFQDAKDGYNKAVEAFHRFRESLPAKASLDMDVQFAIVIGAVCQVTRAIVASNGLLGDGSLHPRGV